MKLEHEQIIQWLKAAEDRNCTKCFHWQDNPELCTLFKQRPPAKVIVVGCDHYDYVPF